jgi:pyrimidine deaminase RibD-like protein
VFKKIDFTEVKDGILLSEGYSREIEGNTHAEECAFIKLALKYPQEDERKKITQGSTIYSTMEPCSKRLSGKTPCITHIINAEVKRVVILEKEPTLFVNCTGVDDLQSKGIEVDILEDFPIEDLNPHLKKNPK